MSRTIRGADLERWHDKNERLNAGYDLELGDRITDYQHDGGVVTLIDTWAGSGEPSVSNHGAVNVKRDDGTEEHYVHFGWRRNFRVERRSGDGA